MSDQYIGSSIRRVDGRLKVAGTARYTADQCVKEMVFAYGVFSTIASGQVVAIDASAARKVPGFIDILHHDHAPALYRVPKSGISVPTILTSAITDESRLPFEDKQVVYAGQFVALVVADTFEHAREAAFLTEVQYVQTTPVATLDQGLALGSPRDGGRRHRRGDPESAFTGAPHSIDVSYCTPVETHNPMEMHATLADWRGDHLHIFEASQGVTVHRNTIAKVFGLMPDNVTVQAAFIGSGFGSKLFMWPHSVAAAAASRMVGRPVKLVVPRAQMFTTTGHRPETLQRLRLATDDTGRLLSIRHESINSTSFTDQFVETTGSVTQSLYSCPNVMISYGTVQTNRGSGTSMRAPGAAPGLFALESAIDEMAYANGMDPRDFRLLNIASRDESVNLPWSSNHLRDAILQAGERFGWDRRNPKIGAMRDGDEIIGYGMGACNWGASRTPAEARVHLRSNGTALVASAIQDIGTGTYTISAQTVAQMTGIPIGRIEVRLGDSDFPPAPMSGGSWATASVLPAIAASARAAIAQLKTYATAPGASFDGVAPDAIQMVDGHLIHADRSIPFEEILKAGRIASAEGQVRTPAAPTGKFSFRSFGAHFVEVRWDPGISRLRIARVVSAIDVGRVINPLTARNQVEGAIVMGIGMALFEATEYDERSGLPANNNFAEYAVPVHADMPEVDVILLDYPDFELNEFGARGIGEIGITGLAAAVANAVYHATGIRVRELPILKEKLMVS